MIKINTTIPTDLLSGMHGENEKKIMEWIGKLSRLETTIKFIEESYQLVKKSPMEHDAYRYLKWVETGERRWFENETE